MKRIRKDEVERIRIPLLDVVLFIDGTSLDDQISYSRIEFGNRHENEDTRKHIIFTGAAGPWSCRWKWRWVFYPVLLHLLWRLFVIVTLTRVAPVETVCLALLTCRLFSQLILSDCFSVRVGGKRVHTLKCQGQYYYHLIVIRTALSKWFTSLSGCRPSLITHVEEKHSSKLFSWSIHLNQCVEKRSCC